MSTSSDLLERTGNSYLPGPNWYRYKGRMISNGTHEVPGYSSLISSGRLKLTSYLILFPHVSPDLPWPRITNHGAFNRSCIVRCSRKMISVASQIYIYIYRSHVVGSMAKDKNKVPEREKKRKQCAKFSTHWNSSILHLNVHRNPRFLCKFDIVRLPKLK